MGVRIRTNVESLVAQKQLSDSKRRLSSSLERLASGKRINKSSDDAAGLAVSERIRARLASLDVSKRNANDGVSYVQVAEGSLNEITSNIIRMRELTSQAASDTLGNQERGYLNKEFQALSREIGRITEATEFNGRKVLNFEQSGGSMSIFVGASNRAAVDGSPPDISPEEDPDVINISMEELESLNQSLTAVSSGDLSIVPDSEEGGAADLGPDGTNALFSTLDTALNEVASYRASLGSVQSRLNSAIQNIEVTVENLSAANSRIQDVDYAAETARFIQSKILATAGASVLSHANQQPEIVLQMLR